jgi:hypothetical protein
MSAFRGKANMLATARIVADCLNRNLATDFHNLVGGQFENIRYTHGVASHRSKDSFLPARDTSATIAGYDRLVTDVKSDVVTINFDILGSAIVEYG